MGTPQTPPQGGVNSVHSKKPLGAVQGARPGQAPTKGAPKGSSNKPAPKKGKR